ncbi:hypothetical protein ACWEQH_27630, partial [Streptomyces sp. NPDC004166]
MTLESAYTQTKVVRGLLGSPSGTPGTSRGERRRHPGTDPPPYCLDGTPLARRVRRRPARPAGDGAGLPP